MAEHGLAHYEEMRGGNEVADARVVPKDNDVEMASAKVDDTATLHDGELVIVSGISYRDSKTYVDQDPLRPQEGGVNYKTMSWWHVSVLMIAETISLGILSLPGAVANLGLIPGILSIIALGILATYSGYVIGQFKLRHPSVHSFADAGFILFGNFGYHLFCWAALLSLIFIMAAHLLTFSVAMNVITGQATCSIVWAVIGFGISVLLTLPRTLKNVSYFSIASFCSITAAVLLVMISLGVKKTDSGHAPVLDVYLFQPRYTLIPTFLALLNICIAFMGNVAFFGFISELRQPRDFPKALILQQSISITFYLIVGCVIYSLVGTAHIVSPALGSASPLIQKIAYGIAMPTIIVAGVINAHVSCKQVYIQLWKWKKAPRMVSKKNGRAVGSWVAIVVVQWFVALVLALSIPVFEQMLGLISALFGSWFTYGVCGMLWVSLNKERILGASRGAMTPTAPGAKDDAEKEPADTTVQSLHSSAMTMKIQQEAREGFCARMGRERLALAVLNAFMLVVGFTLCMLGLYTSINAIMDSDVGKAFSCEAN